MTGFTLGGAGGAQLGGPGGGTLGLSPTDWTLDGRELTTARPIDETATPETLTLTWRVTSEAAVRAFRALKSDQGKVDTLPRDDGGFTAVDRADGANTFTLSPPDRRRPLRQDRTVHVQRYEENLVSQTLNEWNIEVEFVVDADRTDSPSLSLAQQSATAQIGSGGQLGGPGGFQLGGPGGANLGSRTGVPPNVWSLQTPLGELATDRVDADVLGTGDEGVRRFELTARLTREQAHVFEAAYARLRGGRVRTIPDGPNLAVDALDGDVTLTVDAPDGQDAVGDGDYVVREWDSTRLTDRYQSVSVVIAEKA